MSSTMLQLSLGNSVPMTGVTRMGLKASREPVEWIRWGMVVYNCVSLYYLEYE